MGKFTVEYDEKMCVGSGVCEAVAENFWTINRDTMKAHLKDSRKVGEGKFILEISDKDVEENKMAASGCPPGCIKVKDDQGRLLAPV